CIVLGTIYTINLTDSYGDGWNGGLLTVDGVDYTIATGSASSFAVGTCPIPGAKEPIAPIYNTLVKARDSINNYYGVRGITHSDEIDVVNELTIMPNPVFNKMNVYFSLKKSELLNIIIYNSLGQIVHNIASRQFEGINILTVNTQKLSSGIYFLNISSSAKVISKRFIIAKP
ncbi:MAG: T9SS type A sorting domain-containing protein, partial [Saprospiraceae bacterium]|nr:T9SS type A sorting domain-containing protein [Saprospiraceae bacterium]